MTVNDEGRGWGLKAGELVRVAAATLGGGGGGKDDIAQGGGSDPARSRRLFGRWSTRSASASRETPSRKVPLWGAVGIDLGSVRIGSGGSDPDGTLAYPLETLRRDARVAATSTGSPPWCPERGVVEVVVGLPPVDVGSGGPGCQRRAWWATELARRIAPVPVRLVDERLSTVALSEMCDTRACRTCKGRAVVDQAAAVVILQSALDAARAGHTPGAVVPPCDP